MQGVSTNALTNQIDKLFSSILVEQSKIQAISGPERGKETLIAETLEKYSEYRGKGFFYNYIASGRGHGPFTELIDGSVKYDLINGIGPNLLGHSHPIMIRETLESATVDTVVCGNLQIYPAWGDLMEELLKSVEGSRLEHFWFAGSGSFANDMALKILWQKTAPKYTIIAFDGAFAGRSVATQELTAKEAYRSGMPELLSIKRVPHFNPKSPETSLEKTLSSLNKVWEECGNDISAIMLELVQGEAGFVYGPKEYYEGIFRWAKDKGIYIWVDEVQTFGRTHELFAFQMFGLDQYVDMVTVGKALQSCGVFYTKELNPRPGLIAGTFAGTIPTFNVGKKILRYLKEGNFYGDKGRIQEIESYFIKKIKKLMSGSCKKKITEVGGIGLMLYFVVGKGEKEKSLNFLKDLLENGVVAFIAGEDPVKIRLLPPTCLNNSHIDEIAEIIEKTVLEIM